jgi:hypothetical protein
MLDSFEQRLTDMLADALAGVTDIQVVTRPRGDMATVATDPGKVAIVVRALSAAAEHSMGDDSRERRGRKGQFELQTSLRLSGQVALDLIIGDSAGTGLDARRSTLMHVLDVLLATLHRDTVRNGRDFQTGVDLGFDLDGFRLNRLEPPTETPASFSTVRVLYDYSGRFWPVEAPLAGDHISALPTRIAVLPVQVPERVAALAGGPDVKIPLRIDLRSLNGAQVRLAARLQGASPPGTLIGAATEVPPGWVGYTPDSEGVTTIVYRPPATVAGPVRVNVATAISQPSRPSLPLAEMVIEVR